MRNNENRRLRYLAGGIFLSMMLSAALLGCDRLPFLGGTPASGEDIVARLGEVSISANELKWYLESRSESGMPIVDKSGVKARLDELVTIRLLAEAARKQRLESDPPVQFAIDQMLGLQLLNREVIEPTMSREINDQEIEAFFRKHEKEYLRPKQVRLADIFIAVSKNDSPQQKSEKRSTALRILKQAIKLQDERFGFSNLVKQYSDHHPAYPLGDTGYFDADGQPLKLDQALVSRAFSLTEKGKVYEELIEAADGFHIVMLVSSREELKTDLENIRPQIEQRIRTERVQAKREAFIESLSASKSMEIIEEEFEIISQNYLAVHRVKQEEGKPAGISLPGK